MALPGDEDGGARGDDLGGGRLRRCRRRSRWARTSPRAVEHRANAADLLDAVRNERLAAEAGVHRHHEHEIQVAGDVLERDGGRGRVEDRTGLGAELLDEVDRAVQVRHRLDVHRHHVGAGLDEVLDVAVRLLDHQVDVERTRRDAS